MRRFLLIFVFPVFLLCFSCSSDDSGMNSTPNGSEIERPRGVISFLKDKNSSLSETVSSEQIGDTSFIKVPLHANLKSLTANYDIEGTDVRVDEVVQANNETPNDFRNVVTYSYLGKDGETKKLYVKVSYDSKLPIAYLNTENSAIVESRVNTIPGTIRFDGRKKFTSTTKKIEIRGRGNSTWTQPKKPYQIEFEDKEKPLDLPNDKRWVLLANYSDKTMLRNTVAFYMGEESKLDWTPKSEFVEVLLNGKYIGTYQLTQKVEETSKRVEIGNDGYLLEVDFPDRITGEDVVFKVNGLNFKIEEPKNVVPGDSRYNYIQDYITNFHNVLISDDFLDIDRGYAEYIDLDSFVDWYLINEITKNNDAAFGSSVYMNLKPGKKLKMGPIWDFDIAMGNINYNGNETIDGLYIRDNTVWFSRLFEDPEFVDRVKERFAFFESKKDALFEEIDKQAEYLEDAQGYNEFVWRTYGKRVWPNYVAFDTHQEEVDYLKDWLDQRFAWLSEAYSAM